MYLTDTSDEAKKPLPKSSSNIKSKASNKNNSRPTTKDVKQEAVNVQDFFGSKPVEQIDRSICAEKKTVICKIYVIDTRGCPLNLFLPNPLSFSAFVITIT